MWPTVLTVIKDLTFLGVILSSRGFRPVVCRSSGGDGCGHENQGKGLLEEPALVPAYVVGRARFKALFHH